VNKFLVVVLVVLVVVAAAAAAVVVVVVVVVVVERMFINVTRVQKCTSRSRTVLLTAVTLTVDVTRMTAGISRS